MPDTDSLLREGNAALKEGRWQTALEAFEKARELDDSPDAHLGLASALFWFGRLPRMMEHIERAYVGFQNRPDPMYAAASALRLAFHYGLHLVNPAAASGWLARATRLIDEHALEPLRGELVLTRSCLVTDPPQAEALAREALAIGRGAGDADLELCALAELGTALVEQGRVSEGVALLDEAMAACLGGEARSIETVAFTSCLTMVSCANCADFERATQWLRAMERFVERHGSPFHNAECRIVHADVMIATGAWTDAERSLKSAIELCGAFLPSHRADALATLAELRLSQGRLEEAQRLLEGLEPTRKTVPALARLELLRGNDALAAALLTRRLNLIGTTGLEAARLLELLAEIGLGRNEVDLAAERGAALVEIGTSLDCPILRARGARVHGRALLARGDLGGCPLLDRAHSVFGQLGMPYEAARTRRLVAEALRKSDPELAATEAREALAIFEKLGARLDANATAALLRDLGVGHTRAGARSTSTGDGAESLTRREQEVLALLGEGLSNPEIAKRLHVSRKTVEHHVAAVLSKLGLRSRAEAAAEAVRRQRAP